MKNAMKRMALGFVVLAVVALGASPAVAQEEAQEEAEKSWSVDVAVDYSTLYMFRGINLLGEDQEVLTPSVNVAFGNLTIYYYGYYGSFDAFDDDGNPLDDGSYGEGDFGLDYTFSFGEKFSLAIGGVAYLYDGETERGIGYEDTYELYAVAGWDTVLAPTITYCHDMDAIEGGFLTLDLSQELPLSESVALGLMGQLGLDFGYNQPGDPDAGIDESSADMNHWMLGADFAITLTDNLSAHVMAQRFFALDIADDLEQPDETVITAGATFSF